LPAEIRIRLLMRVLSSQGYEGPPQLGKVETLVTALESAMSAAVPRLKQTLAGAVVTLGGERLVIAPAPPRRGRTC
jgi:tRNA(Ile)-lysidine synthase